MMRTLFSRMMYGLLFAVPFAFVSVVWVNASADSDAQAAQQISDCAECHSTLANAWEHGSHGQAAVDPVFVEAWVQQGSPDSCSDCHDPDETETGALSVSGVGCTVCHQPPNNHPTQPMPIDRSAELCGQCHTETTFAWQVSKHSTNELGCVDCHGQHSTTLKMGDVSALCSRCHQERAAGFVHSTHGNEGLSCADCHLAPIEWEGSDVHQVRDHSFYVNLATCERCHSDQLHSAMLAEQTGPAHPTAEVVDLETAGLTVQPDPVNPLSFSLLSGLIGMAGGMILAPWLEKWYRRLD